MANQIRGLPKLSWYNLARFSTVSATSSQQEFPINNVLQTQPSVHWRSSGITSIYEKITGSFPTAQAISCYGLFNTTSTDYSNITVSLYSSTDGTGTPLYTHGAGGMTSIIDILKLSGNASLSDTIPISTVTTYTLQVAIDGGALTTVSFSSPTTPVSLDTIFSSIFAQAAFNFKVDNVTTVSGPDINISLSSITSNKDSNIFIKEPVTNSILGLIRASGVYQYVYLYHKRRPIYGYGEFNYGELDYATGDGFGREWARGYQVNYFSTVPGVRSYTIEFSQPVDSPEAPLDYFKCGLVYLGMHWSPRVGIPQNGYSVGYQSIGDRVRSVSGYLATEKSVSFKRMNLPLNYLTDDEAANVMALLGTNIGQADILVSLFDDNPSIDNLLSTMIGKLVNIPSLDKDPRTRRFNTSLVIEEAV